jgi:hypothetical protein
MEGYFNFHILRDVHQVLFVNRYLSYFGGTSEEDLVIREGQKRAIP